MKILIILTALMSFQAWGQGAVLIEDELGSVPSEKYEINYGPAYRSRKKVGVGFGTGSALGLVGANIELNFTPRASFITSFGLAKNFQTFSMQTKYILGGNSFNPYFSAGYARWYTTSEQGSINKSTPKFLSERFLSAKEKATGEFVENIIYPAFGFQYTQLSGPWSGASVYAEILLLVDVEDLISAPTGGMGMTYYF